MKPTAKIINILIIALFASLLITGCIQVDSNEVGVRVLDVPGFNRVEQSTKGPGWYWNIPYIHTFYKLDMTEQKIEMVEKKPRDEESREMDKNLPTVEELRTMIDSISIPRRSQYEEKPSIRIKTADGNDAWLDVIVNFRIITSKAPIMVQTVGHSIDDAKPIILAETRSTIRKVLGNLNAEEFYDAQLRGKKGEETKDLLNKVLIQFGIEISKISMPAPPIFNEQYQKVLEYRGRAEKARQSFEQLKTTWENAKETKKAEASAQVQSSIARAKGRQARIIKESDAQFYAKQQQAEAMRVKLTTEAQGIADITASLSGPGGKNVVAREISKAIQGKPIILVPAQGGGTINVMDLNELMQSYGAVKTIKGQKGNDSGNNNYGPRMEQPSSVPLMSPPLLPQSDIGLIPELPAAKEPEQKASATETK